MLSTDHLNAREQFYNNIFHWTRVNKDTQRFPGDFSVGIKVVDCTQIEIIYFSNIQEKVIILLIINIIS
jgi:uncharacterized membrane-anchored protein